MPRPRGTALMKCPRCQHENPPHAKFCLECGANLALTCAKCQSTLPTGAKFCLECGEPVATSAASRFAAPEAYTPKSSRREDSHLQDGSRRRAQAGDRSLRRPQGVDGTARRP